MLHNRDILNKNEGEIIIILEVGYIIVQSWFMFLQVKKRTFILMGSSELRGAVISIWSI